MVRDTNKTHTDTVTNKTTIAMGPRIARWAYTARELSYRGGDYFLYMYIYMLLLRKEK